MKGAIPMLKTTRPKGLHPKTTDIAIPSLESIYVAIHSKIQELTADQAEELAKAVHAKCKEIKNNPPARIVTSHKMNFVIRRSPSKRVMYYNMGYPSEYTICPIIGGDLPREMHFRIMTIPAANRIILHYVDKNMSEYSNIPMKF